MRARQARSEVLWFPGAETCLIRWSDSRFWCYSPTYAPAFTWIECYDAVRRSLTHCLQGVHWRVREGRMVLQRLLSVRRSTQHVLHGEARHSLCAETHDQQRLRQIVASSLAGTPRYQRNDFMPSHAPQDRCCPWRCLGSLRALFRRDSGCRDLVHLWS